MSQIAGSNIVITGGASGIGRLTALEMARLGGNPVVWDVHPRLLESVRDELKAISGREHHAYLCDVSDHHAVYATAKQVKEDVGLIQILMNNAGVVSGKSLLDCSDEQIRRTFDVNTMALFWTVRAFLPDMIRAGTGHLVTIASAAGTIGVARLADYCASKWAAVGFDESLRMELKQIAPNVKTTVVCPYYVDTGMFEGVRTRFPLLLPILKEEYIARQIVKAVRRNRQRVFLPRIVGLLPLLRVLPTGVFDAAAGLLGINRSMDEFVGRDQSDSSGQGEDGDPA